MPPATRTVFRLASLLTLLAVMMGSVVCATESGFECGNWPGCSGDALLPSDNVLDTLRATYTRNKMETDTLPWDEAITLVLTNLQPVDYPEFMKGFR